MIRASNGLGLLGDRRGSSERLLVMDRLKKRAPVIDAIFEVIFRTEETYRFGAKRNLLL